MIIYERLKIESKSVRMSQGFEILNFQKQLTITIGCWLLDWYAFCKISFSIYVILLWNLGILDNISKENASNENARKEVESKARENEGYENTSDDCLVPELLGHFFRPLGPQDFFSS